MEHERALLCAHARVNMPSTSHLDRASAKRHPKGGDFAGAVGHPNPAVVTEVPLICAYLHSPPNSCVEALTPER